MNIDNVEYFKNEGLDVLSQAVSGTGSMAHDGIVVDNLNPLPPDLDDLARLHRLIRTRKVLTVLEFGVGFSTLVMADAVAKNKRDFESEFEARKLRCLNPFKVYSVDADEHWIQATRNKAASANLKDFIVFNYSEVHIGTFNDRLCHYFSSLPNIVPDFIYLDAPGGHQVSGSIDGSDFANNLERTVIAADILRLEPTLTPGTMIVVDGRVNNARFLKNNFQRQWDVVEDSAGDVCLMELVEPPLGLYNRERMRFHNLIK